MESITRYCESKIDDSPLSDQEKEEQKHQMKQSADAYNLGVKDGLRMAGKFDGLPNRYRKQNKKTKYGLDIHYHSSCSACG